MTIMTELLEEANTRLSPHKPPVKVPEKKEFVYEGPRAGKANGIWGNNKEDGSSEPWSTYAKKKGLDWNVELHPVIIMDRVHEDYKAVVRSDTKKVFAIMGNRYHPISNAQAFSAFDPLVEKGKARWVDAGSFHDGAQIWGQIEANWKTEVVPKDDVKFYGFLSNTHDGTGKMTISLTAVRIACWNTYQLALKSKELIAEVKHTKNAKNSIASATKILDAMTKEAEKEAALYKRMATMKVATDDVMKFLCIAVPDPQDKSAVRARENARMVREEIMEEIQKGKGHDIEGVLGTGWGVYNGLTSWVDHVKSESARSGTDMLEYQLVGGGHKMKEELRTSFLDHFKLA